MSYEDMIEKVKIAKTNYEDLKILFDSKIKELNILLLSIITNKKEIEELCSSFLENKKINTKLSFSSDKTNLKISFSSFIYNIIIYTDEIVFEVYKEDIKIGSFCYWHNAKNGLEDLQINFWTCSGKKMDTRGLTEENFFLFLDAFKLFSENVQKIFSIMEKQYDDFLQDFEINLKNELSKKEIELKDYKQKFNDKKLIYESLL